jgi:hypothetical protein
MICRKGASCPRLRVGRKEAISPVGSGIRLSAIPPEGLAPTVVWRKVGVLELDFVDPVSGSVNYKFASFSGLFESPMKRGVGGAMRQGRPAEGGKLLSALTVEAHGTFYFYYQTTGEVPRPCMLAPSCDAWFLGRLVIDPCINIVNLKSHF